MCNWQEQPRNTSYLCTKETPRVSWANLIVIIIKNEPCLLAHIYQHYVQQLEERRKLRFPHWWNAAAVVFWTKLKRSARFPDRTIYVGTWEPDFDGLLALKKAKQKGTSSNIPSSCMWHNTTAENKGSKPADASSRTAQSGGICQKNHSDLDRGVDWPIKC